MRNSFFKYLLFGGNKVNRSELESETLPYTFYTLPRNLRNYRIYGNTLTVNGESKSVGDKTDNILNFYDLINSPPGVMPGLDHTFDHVLQLNLKPSTYYTMSSDGYGSMDGDPNESRSLYFYQGTGAYSVFNGHPVTIRTDLSGYVKIGFISSRSNAQQYISGEAVIMLNQGQAKPYEPYGYRIPIVINEHSTNIYLSAPLTKAENNADYIDYKTQKRHNADGTVENVTLPEIDVFDNENEISFGTTVQPSKVYLQGNISEIETVSAQSLQASPQTLDLQPLSLDVMPIDRDEFQINDISEMSVEEIPETENLETTGDEENAE